jgi:hypothetical protein
MFRRPIKPKSSTSQNAFRLRPDPDDDNDDGDRIVRRADKAKKQTKAKRTVVVKSSIARLSDVAEDTAAGDAIAEGSSVHRQSSKQHRTEAFELEREVETNESANTNSSKSTSMYGSDALAQLKAAQRYQKQPVKESTPSLLEKKKEYEYGNDPNVASKAEPAILAGDEALQFMRQQEQSPQSLRFISMMDDDSIKDFYSDQQHHPAIPDPQDDAEASEWEAQVAGRAGLMGREAGQNTPSMASPTRDSMARRHDFSLDQVQEQIGTVISRLQTQQMEAVRTQDRRLAQVSQIQEELQRYENDLISAGQAHEFFQQVRHRLTNWAGALRDLAAKIIPLADAFFDLQAEVAALNRWNDWEDDIASVLHENGCLQRVLGRQPAPSVVDGSQTSMVVDEFGRSAQSQFALNRDKRYRRRQNIRDQRTVSSRGDESDAFLSDSEQECFRERHVALQKAMDVALEELDKEYTKLQNLFDEFEKMHNAYPEEYNQCFMGLSLADLASVLVRVELCALNDPWNESHGYNEGKWTSVIRAAKQSGLLDQAATDRLIEKAVLPVVSSLIDKGGINLSSERQIKSLGVFFSNVQHVVLPESEVLERIRRALVSYVKLTLKDIAIAVVKQPSIMPDSDVLRDAWQGAIVGQMHRLKKVATNLILYWAPFFQSRLTFAEVLVDFIGTKFIFLLSSLHGFDQPRFSPSPADVFHEVWQALQTTDWLVRQDFLLSAAPIRAAHAVYGTGQSLSY